MTLYAVFVVDSLSYKPQDMTIGIGDDQLPTLVENRQFAVGQEVAYQFTTVHAEGRESIAPLHWTDVKRKPNICSIQCGTII